MTTPLRSLADTLNQECLCQTLDHAVLQQQLAGAGLEGQVEALLAQRPHLFSGTAVFLSPARVQAMQAVVAAVVRAAALPGWQAAVQARHGQLHDVSPGPAGVFMGYDFHIDEAGVHLIEINTNAGGPLLNAVLAQAQQRCCGSQPWQAEAGRDLTAVFVDMFREEWRSQRGEAVLRTVAIVDDDPESQYLYPEFLLFRQLFRQHGMEAVIADAAELEWQGGQLQWRGQEIDLVYNRLTDFYLEDPAHHALAAAWQAGAVVLTPHPQAHAVYADKRNLAWLTDPALLAGWGLASDDIAVLGNGIPRTLELDAGNANAFWAERRHWFFKPEAGYGGKAAYRGDKLTTRVWQEICQGGYVAQQLVRPGERSVATEGSTARLKLDVRAYVYREQVQLFAARLYAGQTTNFRTPGGGFAAVFVLEDHDGNRLPCGRECG